MIQPDYSNSLQPSPPLAPAATQVSKTTGAHDGYLQVMAMEYGILTSKMTLPFLSCLTNPLR